MSVNLSPFAGAGAQFFTDNGVPLAGGLLYSYAAGTTTPAVTYTSSTGATPNSNPIVLNAGGRVPNEIWLTAGAAYKFILKNANGVLIGTWDNIRGIGDTEGQNFYVDSFTTLSGQTAFTLSTNPGSVNALTVSLDGAVLTAGTDFTWVGTTLTLLAPAYANQNLRVAYSGSLTTGNVPAGSVTDVSVAAGANIDSNKLSYLSTSVGAVSRTVESKLSDTVSVKDFGAIGDGITDDTIAIQTAINSGLSKTIFVPNGTYRCTSPIILASDSISVIGESVYRTILEIDQVTGAGVHIQSSYCIVKNITVKASNARANYTTGIPYSLETGLYGVQVSTLAAGGYTTATHLEYVFSFNHPNNGFYVGGYNLDSHYINCYASSNRGHGFLFDDRALLGGASNRCGQVTLDTCRALDNGGQALNIDCVTGPAYRFLVYNMETIWNVWNTAIPSLQNAEFRIGGENNVIQQCAVSPGPDGYLRTTTVTGRPRLPAPTPAVGIYIGANSGSLTLIENRFIKTSQGVLTAGTVIGLCLKVVGAYFTQQEPLGVPTDQLFGFNIGSGYKGLDINVADTTSVAYMTRTPTTGGTCRIGIVDGLIYGNNTGGIFKRNGGYYSFTIASNSVNVQSAYSNILASGAVDLVEMVFAGGANLLPSGETIQCFNASAFTITLKHGTSAGYIRTKTGLDTPIVAGGRFTIVTDSSGNPWEA